MSLFSSTTNNHHPSLHQLFHINDYVLVDNFHYGFIEAINASSNTCDVRFVIGEQLQKEISLLRVRVVFLAHNTQLRSNKTRNIDINKIQKSNDNSRSTIKNLELDANNQQIESSLPKINLFNPDFIQPQQGKKSTHNKTSSSSSSSTITGNNSSSSTSCSSTTTTTLQNLYSSFKQAYIQSISYQLPSYTTTNNNAPPPHPLYEFFKQNNERDKGWMRRVIQQVDDVNISKQLLTKEREVLTSLTILSSAIPSHRKEFFGFNGMLIHSFAIHRHTQKTITKSYIENNFEFNRKQRCDKNETVFNSAKKRKSVFTPFNTYKKHMSRHFCNDKSKLSNRELKIKYSTLDENQKKHIVYLPNATVSVPSIYGTICVSS